MTRNGRPSKGTRLRLNLRVTPEVYAAVAAAAVRADVDINEWCATVLAQAARQT